MFLDRNHRMPDYYYNGRLIAVLKEFRKHFLYVPARHGKYKALASHAT